MTRSNPRLVHFERAGLVRLVRRGGERSKGQSLVEFALVFPVFFVLLMGIIEFAFAFNAVLAVNFASRDAALFASEAGNATAADCVILARVEGDVQAPARASAITKIELYRATSNGDPYSPAELTVWTRTGSTSCLMPDGSTVVFPYTRTANGYPAGSATARCNVLAGCGGTHTSLDYIGVRIYYTHLYVTPLSTFVGTGPNFSFTRTNIMRMEPVL